MSINKKRIHKRMDGGVSGRNIFWKVFLTEEDLSTVAADPNSSHLAQGFDLKRRDLRYRTYRHHISSLSQSPPQDGRHKHKKKQLFLSARASETQQEASDTVPLPLAAWTKKHRGSGKVAGE